MPSSFLLLLPNPSASVKGAFVFFKPYLRYPHLHLSVHDSDFFSFCSGFLFPALAFLYRVSTFVVSVCLFFFSLPNYHTHTHARVYMCVDVAMLSASNRDAKVVHVAFYSSSIYFSFYVPYTFPSLGCFSVDAVPKKKFLVHHSILSSRRRAIVFVSWIWQFVCSFVFFSFMIVCLPFHFFQKAAAPLSLFQISVFVFFRNVYSVALPIFFSSFSHVFFFSLLVCLAPHSEKKNGKWKKALTFPYARLQTRLALLAAFK